MVPFPSPTDELPRHNKPSPNFAYITMRQSTDTTIDPRTWFFQPSQNFTYIWETWVQSGYSESIGRIFDYRTCMY